MSGSKIFSGRYLVLVFLSLIIALSTVPLAAHASTRTIYFTNTAFTTWVVPADWNSASNTIEAIGPGAEGAVHVGTTGGVGGGAGAYARITNLSLTVGASVSYRLPGFITSAGPGCDTSLGGVYFNGASAATASITADCGAGGTVALTPGGGGTTAASIGTTKYAGGNGGAHGTRGGGGGGGAGGPNGAGATGANGAAGNGGDGGNADAGFGGAGGAGTAIDSGTPGGDGGNGTEFTASFGSGGGGGGGGGSSAGACGEQGGAGGTYGAGGGGQGATPDAGCPDLPGDHAFGKGGIIIMKYDPVPVPTKILVKGGKFMIRGGKVKLR